jgi:hypothetical protein
LHRVAHHVGSTNAPLIVIARLIRASDTNV